MRVHIHFSFPNCFQNGKQFREYTAASVNNTWKAVGNDIFLDNLNQTLVGGVIDVSIKTVSQFFPALLDSHICF